MRLVYIILTMASAYIFSCTQLQKKAIPVYEAEITDTVKVILRKGNKVRPTQYQKAFDHYEQAITGYSIQNGGNGLLAILTEDTSNRIGLHSIK